MTVDQRRILAKAYGKQRAALAELEATHRAYHTDNQIVRGSAYIRRIADCYADRRGHRLRCDQTLHGDQAAANHASGRREAALAAEKQARRGSGVTEQLSRVTAEVADNMKFPSPTDTEARRLETIRALERQDGIRT